MTEISDYIPKIEDCKNFTKAELRGVRRLVDRIKFDLYVTPDTPSAWAWQDRQKTALAVIEERINHGR